MKSITTKRSVQTILRLTMILCCLRMNGQITFQKEYAATPANQVQSTRDVVPTPDGGYLITGMRMSNAADTNIYIVKLDNMGAMQWTQTYGGSKPDYGYNIIKTVEDDSTYFIVGYTESYGKGPSSTWLLKINGNNGDTLWTKVYGGVSYSKGHEIQPTMDGNYIITGGSDSLHSGHMYAYLMKVDPKGVVIWTKYYGGDTYEMAESVKQSLDGGYIFTGQTDSYGAGAGDVWLVKTDAAGDTTWTKTFGGPLIDEGHWVLANNDGSYIIAAETSSFGVGNIDVWIISTDKNGNQIWAKTYGGVDKDVCHMIQPTLDGNFIVSAISRSFGWVTPRMWLLKVKPTGDTLWTANYTGNAGGHTHCYATMPTTDGGYIAVGHTDNPAGPNTEIMAVKMNADGKQGVLSVKDYSLTNSLFSIFPNPSEGVLNINFAPNFSPASELSVYDLLGKIIYSGKINSVYSNAIIDLSGKEPGIYFVNIRSNGLSSTRRIILEN